MDHSRAIATPSRRGRRGARALPAAEMESSGAVIERGGGGGAAEQEELRQSEEEEGARDVIIGSARLSQEPSRLLLGSWSRRPSGFPVRSPGRRPAKAASTPGPGRHSLVSVGRARVAPGLDHRVSRDRARARGPVATRL